MPRSDEISPVRRFLEQAIMWIILAGTVGMAALVDRGINRLGAARSIGNITIRLPANWRPTDAHGDGRIELRERGERFFARTISVRPLTGGFTLESLFAPTRTLGQEQISLADGMSAKITLRRRVMQDEEFGRPVPVLEVLAVVSVPRGSPIAISIQQVDTRSGREVDLNLELMRRILSTVRLASAS